MPPPSRTAGPDARQFHLLHRESAHSQPVSVTRASGSSQCLFVSTLLPSHRRRRCPHGLLPYHQIPRKRIAEKPYRLLEQAVAGQASSHQAMRMPPSLRTLFDSNVSRSSLHTPQSVSWANRHGMVKDVVRVVLLLYSLQRWNQASVTVVQLLPERIGEHILVRIVDVTAFILVIPIRSALIFRV